MLPWNFETTYYKDVTPQQFLGLDNHVKSLKMHFYNQLDMSAEDVQKRWPDLEGDVLRTLLADGAFGNEQPLPAIADVVAAYRKSDGGENSANAGEPCGVTTDQLRE